MLCRRVVTVLTFNRGILFRTRNFVPDYRYTANFVDTWSVDELVLLDITRYGEIADREGRDIFLRIVAEFAARCFVPLSVGGGVRSREDISRLLQTGADKVILNTGALQNPELVEQAARSFGSQCIVGSIDVRCCGGDYAVFSSRGGVETGWRPEKWAARLEELGAGEIIIQSIDRDGTLEGYDNDLNLRVSQAVKLPVLVCGGAGKWQDFVDGFLLGGASAVCTTNIYHFTEHSIRSAKDFLSKAGLNVRISSEYKGVFL